MIGGIAQSQTFRGNDAYDPDVLTANQHPSGFTQWMAFYRNWVVLGSKITLFISNEGLSTTDFYLFPSTNSSLSGSSLFLNNPNTIYKMLAPAGSGRTMTKISMYRSTKRVFGNPIVNNDDFWGTSTTSPQPTARWYWQIYAATKEASPAALELRVTVRIKYYIRFFNKKNDIILSEGLIGPETTDPPDEADPADIVPNPYVP